MFNYSSTASPTINTRLFTRSLNYKVTFGHKHFLNLKVNDSPQNEYTALSMSHFLPLITMDGRIRHERTGTM